MFCQLVFQQQQKKLLLELSTMFLSLLNYRIKTEEKT